jgi:hypothetical protein
MWAADFSGWRNEMAETRRRVLMTLAGGGVVMAAGRLGFGQRRPEPQPMPSPNAPNPAYPPGLNDWPENKRDPDVKQVDPLKQQELRFDVEKLYQLVSELKKEVEATDARVALSVGVVKKAQEVEKLAKQIKNLSKG